MRMTEQEAMQNISEIAIDYAECGEEAVCEALDMAIKALGKQIPKKAIRGGLYACPCCRTLLLYGVFEAKGNCCKNCGQRLDWSEV